MNTKITIGLCAKNAAKNIETAFDSISIQDYPHELMKLIIVVDGSDNTLSLASKFAKKTDIPTSVVSSKDKGLGAARQIVVENAEGDYIVWVDDDLVLTKDYVRNQVEFMEKNPNVGAARCAYNKLSTQPLIGILNFVYLIPAKAFDYIGTPGSIFRLKALENVGGFDVRIKGAGEDIDVSRRIRKSGWMLVANDSARLHSKYAPATLKAYLKRSLHYGYGNHFLFHKHRDKQLLLNFLPPFVILSSIIVSCKLYRITNLKRTFAFFIFNTFSTGAADLGFIRAHLDGYGHSRA